MRSLTTTTRLSISLPFKKYSCASPEIAAMTRVTAQQYLLCSSVLFREITVTCFLAFTLKCYNCFSLLFYLGTFRRRFFFLRARCCHEDVFVQNFVNASEREADYFLSMHR